MRHAALGDDARAPRWVETIAKRGYRWIGDGGPADRAAASAPALAAVPAPALEPTPGPAAAAPAPTPAHPRTRTPRFAALAIGLVALATALAWWTGAGGPPQAGAGAVPAPVDAVQLLARADDFYFQFSRADNEAALELYQRVLAIALLHAGATRGLAAVLAQGGDAAAAARLCDELAQRLGPAEACPGPR